MNPLLGFAVFILALATNLRYVNSADWANVIINAFPKRDKFLIPLRSAASATKTEDIFKLIPALQELSSKFKILHIVDFTKVKKPRDALALRLFKNIEESYTKIPIRDLSRQKALENDYDNIGLGAILSKFKSYYDEECLNRLVSPKTKEKDIKLPLDFMCSSLRQKKHDETYASITNVCKDANTCVKSNDAKSQNACGTEDECDIKKAIPHFGAMIWYKVSDYLANVICGSYGKSKQAKVYAAIGKDLKHFEGYLSMLGWIGFFDEAVEDGGFATLGKFVTIVEKRASLMSHVLLACNELKAESMCIVSDILKQYSMLNQIKTGYLRTGPIRDLRRIADYDIKGLLELDNADLKHMKIMASSRSGQENLEKLSKGLSQHFGTLASFDERIANADVGYIDAELKKYNSNAARVSKKLQDDCKALMKNMQTVLAVELVLKLAGLVATVAENANPFKVLFTGVNAGEILTKTNEVAAATAGVGTGAALIEAVTDLAKDSKTLTDKFAQNRKQINSLQKVVETITAGKSSEIEEHLDLFVEQYGAYTPKQERSLLVANDAKWSAFIDRACDLLQSAEGGAAPTGQAVAGGTLVCEHLQGTLAEFAAIREDIYDFQFDIVDALARVVRGNIAKKLAANIKTKNKVANVYTLVRGFFMQHYKLQSRIYLYCNLLEYRQHGKKLDLCPDTGFFDYKNINELLRETLGIPVEESRFAIIPTRPEYPGDMGYINLHDLAAGKEVTFQFPRNRTWLMNYNWVMCNDVIAPTVKSIKVYLPLKDYKTKQQTNTETVLTADFGSFVHYKKDVRYVLPENRGVYSTKYEENFLRGQCHRSNRQHHPYSACDAKMSDICDNTVQNVKPTIRPTILSTWKLKYSITSGSQSIKWDVPNPATNLYLQADVILEMYRDESIKCKTSSRIRKSPEKLCCPDGKYLLRWQKICTDCPKNSHTALHGYYCEKNKAEGRMD